MSELGIKDSTLQQPFDVKALRWIIALLEERHIPYVICGGLAARLYGASRKLYDIDIFVPDQYMSIVAEAAAKFMVDKPHYHKSAQWELTFMSLQFHGQLIEICSDKNCRIYDSVQDVWATLGVDFDNVASRDLAGVALRVMDKKSLIAYKSVLNRPVDLDDICQIE